jgi:H+/Cl- antiporter ClcA
VSYQENLLAPKPGGEVVMFHDISRDVPGDTDSDAPAASEQMARQEAIERIERRRRFWIRTVVAAVGMIILVAIWATSEYHNAGGWPTHGFSQSSGIHDVWNYWIIYPFIAWVLLTAANGWFVYRRRRPISESEIRREVERQAGPRR